jgi:hypothetical protein
MQGSLTQTKQGIVGRTTAITSDVLIEKEKSLSHAIGLGKITFLYAQENGLVMIMAEQNVYKYCTNLVPRLFALTLLPRPQSEEPGYEVDIAPSLMVQSFSFVSRLKIGILNEMRGHLQAK